MLSLIQEALCEPLAAGEEALFPFPLTRSATVEEEEENEEALETAFDHMFDMTFETGLLQEIKIAEVSAGVQ